MNWELISLPVMGALIGWGTNVIAIKMLFWPRKPIKIFGWEFLGVLPRRKLDIAKSIGEVLNDDLLPADELIAAINTPENRQRISSLITEHLATKLQRYLPRFILEHTEQKIRYHLEELVANELEHLFSQLGMNLSAELKENNFLGNLVEEKIKSFDLVHLESLVLKVAKNELRYVELFGGVIGFVIGIFQILLLALFQ
ncbi:MAG: DUF445 family protein [Firmicutes bacterium]|nr:DUF445 family protein [Bacillota bacterium]